MLRAFIFPPYGPPHHIHTMLPYPATQTADLLNKAFWVKLIH